MKNPNSFLFALVTLVACAGGLGKAKADLMADSPVKFPEQGPLPAKYPPDQSAKTNEAPELDYYLFRTPERSLGQIAKIQAEMPAGEFAPPPQNWQHLQRTRRLLTEGGELRLLALGDSIVNDAMRSGWVARLQEAYPKAAIQALVYVRGGGGCQHFKTAGRIANNVIPRKPDLCFDWREQSAGHREYPGGHPPVARGVAGGGNCAGHGRLWDGRSTPARSLGPNPIFRDGALWQCAQDLGRG